MHGIVNIKYKHLSTNLLLTSLNITADAFVWHYNRKDLVSPSLNNRNQNKGVVSLLTDPCSADFGLETQFRIAVSSSALFNDAINC